MMSFLRGGLQYLLQLLKSYSKRSGGVELKFNVECPAIPADIQTLYDCDVLFCGASISIMFGETLIMSEC